MAPASALPTAPCRAAQFGSGLTPADLATLHGAATNLAVFAAKHAAAGALATFGPDSPWAALRDAAGLPRAGRRWPLPAALARPLRVRERRACGVLKEVILSSWLFEYPFALQPHQVCCVCMRIVAQSSQAGCMRS